MSEMILIDNRNIKLEAEWFESEDVSLPTALIAHPHPQFGGNMHNNVVSAIFNKFIKEGISCLRFNFRGVGNSTEAHSNGKGELEDVKACIDFLIKNKGKEKIGIIGYSYGAAIACSVVNYSASIVGFVAISFPWDFMGEEYKQSSKTSKPKFFIQGNQDTVASFNKFFSHYAEYSEPKQHAIIEGADHFYWGHENALSEIALKFFKSL